MEAIRKKAELVRYTAGDGKAVTRLYQQAEKEHQESQRQGKFLGTNSYHLLNFKLDKYLEQGEKPAILGRDHDCWPRRTTGTAHRLDLNLWSLATTGASPRTFSANPWSPPRFLAVASGR